MANQKVSFSSVPKTFSYSQTPGSYIDISEPSFMLQVSPKGKAIWRSRLKGHDGKEVGKVVEFEVSIDERGQRSTNYELAKQKARDMHKFARMDEFERSRQIGRTLESGFELYLVNRRKKNTKPLADRTKRDYRKDYETYLKAKCGHWVLKDTKAGQWEDVFREIHDRTPAKASSSHALVSGIYNYLIGRDELEVNPMAKVRMQRFLTKPEPRTKQVETMDLVRFVNNVKGLRVRHSRDIAMLYLTTGIRHVALLSMRWDQLDLENGYYCVPPDVEGWKGFSGLLPLSDFVIELLRKRREQELVEGRDSEWIFPARNVDSKVPHRVDAKEALLRVSEGLPSRIGAHDLRRTWAGLVNIVLPGDIKTVGMLLTHKWAIDSAKSPGELKPGQATITLRYLTPQLKRARVSVNRVTKFLLEISGLRPMTDETIAIAEAEGIDPHALVLPATDSDNAEDAK
jgi:integrase